MKKYVLILTLTAATTGGCSAGAMAGGGLPSPTPVQTELKEFERDNDKAEDRAELLADEIKKLPGIEHAAVVITGSSAIIGIVLQGDGMGDTELVELKKRVEKAALGFDNGLKRVSISAAAELYDRITKMAGEKTPEEERGLGENGLDSNFPFHIAPGF